MGELEEGMTALNATFLVGDDVGVVIGTDKKLCSGSTLFTTSIDRAVEDFEKVATLELDVIDLYLDEDDVLLVDILLVDKPLKPIRTKIRLKLVAPPWKFILSRHSFRIKGKVGVIL